MTSWEVFNTIRDILIQYYFGDALTFYAGISVLFFLGLVLAGLDFRLALVFSLPLIGAFGLGAVWAGHTWITALLLIVVSIIYAYALIDLFT
jgi:hypothetical protein